MTQRTADGQGSSSNARLAIGGLIAIAVLVAVGVGVSSRVSEDRLPASAPRVTAQRPPGSAASDPVAPSPTVPAASAWKLTGGVSKVNAVTRRESAVVGRGEMVDGLSGLGDLVRRCGAQEASFLLLLEASGGSVRVESARLEEQGTAPKAAVACAESALSGRSFPAPNVPAGRRWEIPFSAGSL